MNIEELKKNRESQINGIFILMIEIAFIFAIPAAIAILIGKYLKKGSLVGYMPLFLIISFACSWVIVILMYKKKTKALQKTEELIKKVGKENV